MKTENIYNIDQERLLYIDILRIISIFAVIIIHVSAKWFENSSLSTNSINYQIVNVYDCVTRFGVPVFVMISGVFFLNPQKKYQIKKLFFKKNIRILTAFLFWQTIYVIIQLYELEEEITFRKIIHGIFDVHYHLWYLFMICGLYISSPLLKYIIKDKNMVRYFLFLSLLFVFLPNFFLLFNKYKLIKYLIDFINRLDIKIVYGYSTYFILGYILSKANLKNKYIKLIYLLGSFSIFMTVVFNGIIEIKMKHHVNLYYKTFLPNICCFSVFVFVLFKELFKHICLTINFSKILTMIGKMTFGIYLIHALFADHIKFIGFQFFLNYPIISIPLISLSIFILSLLLTGIISKIPILNKYVI